MTSIVFTQFSDDLPVDPNKEYYVSPIFKNTGLQEIHKLCLFPDKLREYLVKLGDNLKQTHINAITTFKWTPLMIASRNGVTESVKLLLKNRANINLQNNYGWTALMLACANCNTNSSIECVKLLLDHSLAMGADINLQDKEGWTALMFACRYCNTNSNIECVKLLLNQGVNINFQEQEGWTALIIACRYCNTTSSIECVKLLLEYGADVNIQNIYETTALMFACRYCNTTSSIQCIKLLLQHYELTSQEIDLKPLIDNNLLTKELYPVFLPYLINIEDTDLLKLLPLELLVEIIKIKNNIIKQSNKLKEFDLDNIILYEMKKCL